MSGAILAMLCSTPSGGGGGGGGGDTSDLTVSLSPDPLYYASSGSAFYATGYTAISGGLAPYTVDWFLSGGDAQGLFVSTESATIESVSGDNAELYCQVTDALSAVATSNTVTLQLP